MKPLVSILCVSIVLWSFSNGSAGQDANPLPAPVSNTIASNRGVQIIWASGVTPPDVTRVLKRLFGEEAREIGQQFLKVEGDPNWLAVPPGIEVKDDSCRVRFVVGVDPDTGARRATKEVADAMVGRLSELLISTRREEARDHLQTAEKQQTELQAKLDEFRQRVKETRARLSTEANRADLTFATLQASIGNLADERQRLELDLAGMEARFEAVQEQVKESTVRVGQQADEDPTTPELEKSLAARELRLQLMRELHVRGNATPSEVAEAEAELADIRVKHLDRRAAAAARAADSLAPLTREMQTIAIDIRDRKARLAQVEARLKPLRGVVQGFQELEWLQEDAVGVRQAWEDANIRLRELRRQLDATPVDRVIVTDASDTPASAPEGK